MKKQLAINGGKPICKELKAFNTIGKEELLNVKKVMKSGILSGFFAKKRERKRILGRKICSRF